MSEKNNFKLCCPACKKEPGVTIAGNLDIEIDEPGEKFGYSYDCPNCSAMISGMYRFRNEGS